MSFSWEPINPDLIQSFIPSSRSFIFFSIGMYHWKKVNINPSIMDDKEMLEDLIAAAVNDANRKVDEQSSKKMEGATPGLPGGFKLPF